MKPISLGLLLLALWLVTCAPAPAVDMRWDQAPEAHIVLATHCCDGPTTQELVRPYIPEAQLWGDGHLIWVEHSTGGERRVMERQLSSDEMTALLQKIVVIGLFVASRPPHPS